MPCGFERKASDVGLRASDAIQMRANVDDVVPNIGNVVPNVGNVNPNVEDVIPKGNKAIPNVGEMAYEFVRTGLFLQYLRCKHCTASFFFVLLRQVWAQMLCVRIQRRDAPLRTAFGSLGIKRQGELHLKGRPKMP